MTTREKLIDCYFRANGDKERFSDNLGVDFGYAIFEERDILSNVKELTGKDFNIFVNEDYSNLPPVIVYNGNLENLAKISEYVLYCKKYDGNIPQNRIAFYDKKAKTFHIGTTLEIWIPSELALYWYVNNMSRIDLSSSQKPNISNEFIKNYSDKLHIDFDFSRFTNEWFFEFFNVLRRAAVWF